MAYTAASAVGGSAVGKYVTDGIMDALSKFPPPYLSRELFVNLTPPVEIIGMVIGAFVGLGLGMSLRVYAHMHSDFRV